MNQSNNIIKVALDFLGCKLNQAEIETMAQQLAEAGYTLVKTSEKADIYILNTCTVTHIADRKSRHLLRAVHRNNPDCRLVVTGCYAQRVPQELQKIAGVDLVISNEQKPELVNLLGKMRPGNTPDITPYQGVRTRTFVKVQDGCRSLCTYCIVPLVRSRENSVPAEQVISLVKQRVDTGYKEVVLTGTEIGRYRDKAGDLTYLIRRILTETNVTRLRISSLQPQEISEELVSLWQDNRLCPHFHISLQSGCDEILKMMKRRYTTTGYNHAVSLIRRTIPEAAITTDVITSFPGETDTNFRDSYDFCQQTNFARIHVFPYSSRPGTEAAQMLQDIPDNIKRQRNLKMLNLAKTSARNFHREFYGRVMMVLWEQEYDGIWSGLTGNYIRVYTRSKRNLTNEILPIKLEENWRDGAWGEVT
jgi:threonylcarbamoyladenosine tRNA methylthiotransferase MtaB